MWDKLRSRVGAIISLFIVNSTRLDHSGLNSYPPPASPCWTGDSSATFSCFSALKQDRSLNSWIILSLPGIVVRARTSLTKAFMVVLLPGWWVPRDTRGPPHSGSRLLRGSSEPFFLDLVTLWAPAPLSTLRTGCLNCLSKLEEFPFSVTPWVTYSFKDIDFYTSPLQKPGSIEPWLCAEMGG